MAVANWTRNHCASGQISTARDARRGRCAGPGLTHQASVAGSAAQCPAATVGDRTAILALYRTSTGGADRRDARPGAAALSSGTYMPAGTAVTGTSEKVGLATVGDCAVTISESRIARSNSASSAYAGWAGIIYGTRLAASAAVENVSAHRGANAAAQALASGTAGRYAVTSAIADGSSRTARSARSQGWLAGYTGSTNAGSAGSCLWWNVSIVDHADDVAAAIALAGVAVSGRARNYGPSGQVHAAGNASGVCGGALPGDAGLAGGAHVAAGATVVDVSEEIDLASVSGVAVAVAKTGIAGVVAEALVAAGRR